MYFSFSFDWEKLRFFALGVGVIINTRKQDVLVSWSWWTRMASWIISLRLIIIMSLSFISFPFETELEFLSHPPLKADKPSSTVKIVCYKNGGKATNTSKAKMEINVWRALVSSEHAYADKHIYKSERDIGMVVFWKTDVKQRASCCVGSEKIYNTFMLSCFSPFFFLPSFNQKILYSDQGLTSISMRTEGRGFIRSVDTTNTLF